MNDAEKNLSFLPHIREFLRSLKMNVKFITVVWYCMLQDFQVK